MKEYQDIIKLINTAKDKLEELNVFKQGEEENTAIIHLKNTLYWVEEGMKKSSKKPG